MVPLQGFAAGVLADVVRQQPSSPERTRFAWQLAVGATLARVTRVEMTGGVLTVRADDPRWLHEISRQRDGILLKMQHLLGRGEPGLIKCVKA